MLAALKADGVELDTFWTDEEFAALLGERPYRGLTDENAVIEPPDTDIARGDLFALGRHLVLWGDATVAADMERLLAGHTPVLLVTDPPYGVAYDPLWRHRVNPRQRTAAGRPVPLTVTEYDLLRALSVNAGRVLTHEYLLRRVWGPQNSGDARLVRAFVKKLRRKLGDVATSPAYIVTEPRVGYRMPKAVSSEPSGC